MRPYTPGARLRQLMQERNLKQKDILEMSKPYQEKLGIRLSKSHLSQYVNDKSRPDQNKYYLLSLALDVSEPWLMGFDVDICRIPDKERLVEGMQIKNTPTLEKIDGTDDPPCNSTENKLSRSEQRLLNSFNELNGGAQSKVLSYIDDLKANRKNLKNINSEEYGEFSQELA